MFVIVFVTKKILNWTCLRSEFVPVENVYMKIVDNVDIKCQFSNFPVG